MVSQEISQIIKVLIGLQKSDHELIKIKRERMLVEKQIKHREGLDRLDKMLEIAKTNTLNAKLRVARVKSEITTYLEQESQLEKRLYDGTITNTRELKSVEADQAELRRKIAREEEKIAPYESNVAAVEKKEQEVAAQLTETEQKWSETAPQYQQKVTEYGNQLKKLFTSRKKFTEQIPSDYVKLYEQLFKKSKGIAVAPVSRGICLGCHITLPLNKVNEIKNGKNLPRCSNCARILIFD